MTTGIRQQNVGSDYRGTLGLYVPVSGGDANKAVAYSELDNAISALTSAYTSAIGTEATARAAAIAALNNLSTGDVQTLISTAISGGIRYKGLAEADETDPQAATGQTSFATGDLYKISSNGSSAFGVALNVGDMVIYNSVNGWDKIDNTDPSVSAPSGDAIAVTQTGDNAYSVSLKSAFVSRVSALESGLSTAESDISTLQSSSSSQASAISTLTSGLASAVAVNTTQTSAISALSTRAGNIESSVAGVASDLATATTAIAATDAAQDSAISTLQSGLSAAVVVNSTQTSDISDLSDRATAIEAVDATQTSDIAALQTAVAAKIAASQLSAAVANFYKACHKKVSLTGGVSTTAGNIVTTVFYVDPGFGSLEFTITELNAAAAPYERTAEPQIEKVSQNASGTAGNFAKFSFWGLSAVADSAISFYAIRIYGASETPTVTVS